MSTIEQPEEKSHICDGDTYPPEFLAEMRLTYPWVYVLSNEEHIVEYQGTFTKYLNGEPVAADDQPKG